MVLVIYMEIADAPGQRTKKWPADPVCLKCMQALINELFLKGSFCTFLMIFNDIQMYFSKLTAKRSYEQ